MSRQTKVGACPQVENASSSAKEFTIEERAAMRERAHELKAEARGSKTRAAGEKDVLSAIAKMPEPDRSMVRRLHALI